MVTQHQRRNRNRGLEWQVGTSVQLCTALLFGRDGLTGAIHNDALR